MSTQLKNPSVVGVEEGSDVYATLIEHGAPVWKRGTVRALLPHLRFRVEIAGQLHTLRQEDVRSVHHLLRTVH